MAITAPASTTALARIALTIRQRTIETSASARIPHLGSCLSCVDLLTALYWQELRIDPQDPEAPDRDRFRAEQRPWSTRAVPGAGGTGLFPN